MARKVVELLEPNGSSPYAKWFARLDAVAAAKVSTALYRMGQGNLSNVKPVGQGVAEYRLDLGPGYRIYIGRERRTDHPAPRRHQEGPERRHSTGPTTLARLQSAQEEVSTMPITRKTRQSRFRLIDDVEHRQLFHPSLAGF